MNGLIVDWLAVALIFALSIVLLVLFRKRVEFEVFNDLIIIHDFAYPANIPNYAIKSITLIEKLPKVMMRSNGYGGWKMWKGIFRIIGGERAAFYVEDHFHGPVIKIETVRESFYISYKDKEQTKQLYDELTNKVKLLSESDLTDCKLVSTVRSWIIVSVFVAVLILISLIPTI